MGRFEERRRRHRSSVNALSFAVRRLRERPMALRKASCLHWLPNGGFDVRRNGRRRSDHARQARQRVEIITPNTLPTPLAEAIVARRIRPLGERKVVSVRSRVQHGAAGHPPILDVMRPAPPLRQQRLDPTPFRFARAYQSIPPSLHRTESLNRILASGGIPRLSTDPRGRRHRGNRRTTVDPRPENRLGPA